MDETKNFDVFLSVVIIIRNSGTFLKSLIGNLHNIVDLIADDYELIIVDNGSTDSSLAILKELASSDGLSNLQVYVLTKEVRDDTATCAGLENAIGDYVAVIDLLQDDIELLPSMLDKAMGGADVVYVNNIFEPRQGWVYRQTSKFFNIIYNYLCGINLLRETSSYRLMSRRVINFILQHPQPALIYRHLPSTGGFARTAIEHSYEPKSDISKSILESMDRGMRLLVSTTQAPMRLVTTLSLFGAFVNLIYSVYVVIVGIFMVDVAPGWISLSLQQSGMFCLLSLVLLILGEYILHMASLSNEGPLYHVAQEFMSSCVVRRKKLNIECAPSEKSAPRHF